jgi:hypothetical protein
VSPQGSTKYSQCFAKKQNGVSRILRKIESSSLTLTIQLFLSLRVFDDELLFLALTLFTVITFRAPALHLPSLQPAFFSLSFCIFRWHNKSAVITLDHRLCLYYLSDQPFPFPSSIKSEERTRVYAFCLVAESKKRYVKVVTFQCVIVRLYRLSVAR